MARFEEGLLKLGRICDAGGQIYRNINQRGEHRAIRR